MIKVKFCGMMRMEDIQVANELQPEYIGFIFAPMSKRYILPEDAKVLKHALDPSIEAVGVFVNEELETVGALLERGVIDIAQLHGEEDESYIRKLQERSNKQVMKAFRIERAEDVERAIHSCADAILLDAGAGEGRVFDWQLLKYIERPYFLAGGLSPENMQEAIDMLHPYALDVSSGIETDGRKDSQKMKRFITKVREGE